jgi:hypothetical protein
MPFSPMIDLPVLIDSREQNPWEFPAKHLQFRVTTERDALPTGDYSIKGHAGRYGERAGLCIERKAGWMELAKNTTGKDQTRFVNELERMKAFDLRYLVVCQSPEALKMGQLPPHIDTARLINQVLNLCERYKVLFYFARDHQAGSRFAMGVLNRYALRCGLHRTTSLEF